MSKESNRMIPVTPFRFHIFVMPNGDDKLAYSVSERFGLFFVGQNWLSAIANICPVEGDFGVATQKDLGTAEKMAAPIERDNGGHYLSNIAGHRSPMLDPFHFAVSDLEGSVSVAISPARDVATRSAVEFYRDHWFPFVCWLISRVESAGHTTPIRRW
jgi:hypothetical protein